MAKTTKKQDKGEDYFTYTWITFRVNVVLNVGISGKSISCWQNEMMSKAIEFKDEIQKFIETDPMWSDTKIERMEVLIHYTEFKNLPKG